MDAIAVFIGFITSLVTVFMLCMVIIRKLAQRKASLQRHQWQRSLVLKENHAAWRNNQQMLMD
jgi:hypothetical protein